jgi:formate dehydrogenase alpha subunit
MKLTIDGLEVACRDGSTILEAARGAGIAIPSLCDHPGLEPFAGCRICLVEVEGRRDFAPACATAAAEGQIVRTRTPEIVALRKGILEFILAQHPYACLVCPEKTTCDDLKSTIRKTGEVTGCVLCPQNGRCQLQKVAADVGLEKVDLPAAYRNIEVHREDPFFDRDYNLCILCGRCIRVCEEVRGAAVLSFIHRGGRTEVGTAFERPLLDSGCRFCGACVDVCPTGALVERAFRPQAAATRAARIVCPFCAQGCILALDIREDRILDAKPIDVPPNQGQACVKGRFLVRGAVAGPGRILEPHVRKDGRLEPATFEEALDRAAAGLRAAADGRRALVFPSQVPLEDALSFLEFGRDVLAGPAAASPAPVLGAALDAFAEKHGLTIPGAGEFSGIAEARTILAWTIDLPQDHPIAWLNVVRAVRRGAGFIAAGQTPAGPIGRQAVSLDLAPGTPAVVAGLASALLKLRPAPVASLEGIEEFRGSLPAGGAAARARRPYEEAARLLAGDGPAVILFDAGAVEGASGAEDLDWLWNLALIAGARLVPLSRHANERGLQALARALRSSAVAATGLGEVWAGLEARAFEAIFLAGPLPDLGGLKPSFLVCQDTHWSPNAEQADVVLPAAAFAESGGTWVNAEGRVLASEPALPGQGASRPDRDLLAALAGRMGQAGFSGHRDEAVLRRLFGPGPDHVGPDAGPAGPLRLVPVSTPAPHKGRRPAARAGSAGPERPKEVLRGYDLIAGSRGYARTRRVR